MLFRCFNPRTFLRFLASAFRFILDLHSPPFLFGGFCMVIIWAGTEEKGMKFLPLDFTAKNEVRSFI